MPPAARPTGAELRLPRLDEYPERRVAPSTRFDDIALKALGAVLPLGLRSPPLGARAPLLRVVRRAGRRLADQGALDASGAAAEALRSRRPALVQALRRGAPRRALLAECLALLRRVSEDTLGVSPYDVQLLAVASLLRGEVCEMRTGEGKSLAAALAAALMALAGRPVHVITVNDYLAGRDLEEHRALFEALGLSCAMVTETTPTEARHAAYGADILYAAAKTVVFDYLRDQSAGRSRPPTRLSAKLVRLTGERPEAERILRGLPAAIVDEADSVLIDQAVTPFILAGREVALGGLEPDLLQQAFRISAGLRRGRDHLVRPGERRVLLTAEGKRRLRVACAGRDDLLAVPAIQQHLVTQALAARETLQRGRDYIVEDGKVSVVDEATGRRMPDRQWSDGLHQMVELHENLDMTEMRATTARISFQQFFARYLHLCGMTGTARTAARELWRVYGLRVRRIRPRRGDARRWERVQVVATAEARWRAVANRAAALRVRGVPVLIGTRCIAASEACSRALAAQDIPHEVLNASSAAREATIVAQAGQVGRVTVATNMAGRGTDIRLSPEARKLGGLTVVLTGLHDDRRIDLQLCGRCGRQGEPGRVLRLLSLEDDLIASAPPLLYRVARAALWLGGARAAFAVMRLAQALRSAAQSRVRDRLRADKRRRQQALGIAGVEE